MLKRSSLGEATGFLFLLLLFFTAAFPQAVRPDALGSRRKIESYLGKLEKIGYSGVVLVAIGGKPVISRGYGYADVERKIRNSPETVFDIGSVTKQFTAAAILKLQMQGKLSTADKITKYFDGVAQDKESITIHDLLRHSSGLPGGIGGDFDEITEKEFIEKVLSVKLEDPPGKHFSYSNIGYSLLGLIVEKASGGSYEEYLYKELWKPAGMEWTGYTRPKYKAEMIAAGYREQKLWGKPNEKKWAGDAPFLHLKGNGGVLSTIGDLYKWDEALNGDGVLSKDAKKRLYFPALREDEKGDSHYGYGWDVQRTDRNTTRVWHNGTNRVFFSDFFRFIDEGVTIIVLTNSWQDDFPPTGGRISRIIFEKDFVPPMPLADNDANRAFTRQTIEIALKDGTDAALAGVKKREKGVDLLERLVNAEGYDLLGEKKFAEAIKLFRLNTEVFQRSANAFDSLGEAYMESGNKVLAAENYRKALALDPMNENAREVLRKLENP